MSAKNVFNAVLFLVAVLGGLAIAYVDLRPTWDDAGITAMAMLSLAGAVGRRFIGRSLANPR